MHHIDYGLSVFSTRAFAEMPEVFDLSDLIARLLARGELAGHEVDKRFYEVGSPQGLAELEAFLAQQNAEAR
jgi:NDP-sugar pyrophosphorylase family protein